MFLVGRHDLGLAGKALRCYRNLKGDEIKWPT